MRIGCDIDGVVADAVPVILKYISEKNPQITKKEDLTSYEVFYETFRPEEMGNLFRNFEQTGEFKMMEPIEGAVEGIRYLNSLGYSIDFITARDYYDSIHQETLNWLKNNGFEFDGELFCQRDKLKIIRERGIELMIDDSPFNIGNLSKHGINCICVDQPWNTWTPETKLIKRCRNWKEIGEYIVKNF